MALSSIPKTPANVYLSLLKLPSPTPRPNKRTKMPFALLCSVYLNLSRPLPGAFPTPSLLWRAWKMPYNILYSAYDDLLKPGLYLVKTLGYNFFFISNIHQLHCILDCLVSRKWTPWTADGRWRSGKQTRSWTHRALRSMASFGRSFGYSFHLENQYLRISPSPWWPTLEFGRKRIQSI